MSGSGRIYPLKDRQLDAVDPSETVWLSASAGTGKTQVLSARVLRLLLQKDVEPSQILCLTFTRAGAAEMATRVNNVLAKWVRADAVALAEDLRAIGADFGPETIARARTRFAAVLDCPGGGLRIETIHAFSQWLLSAFPTEAGLAPGSRAMEDRDRELLLRETLAELLLKAEAHADESLIDALAMLSLRMDATGIERFLVACASARDAWEGTGAWIPPLLPRVNRLLGLAADHSRKDVEALCADGAFDVDAVSAAIAMLRHGSGKKAADAADGGAEWLVLGPPERLENLGVLRGTFFTQKGDPRKLMKDETAYDGVVARIGKSLDTVERAQVLGGLAEWLAPALTLGRAFALAWSEAKARTGLIDFEDQIAGAAQLLQRSEMADWIRYKLDRRFDHVLVDEAQDTNIAQWQVIEALSEEFFAGKGAHDDALRTLFVVGDYKQAIFGFQGTSPENFEEARQLIKRRMDEARANAGERRGGTNLHPLREYGLARSYRTAQSVLDFVDEAVMAIGHEAFGLREHPGRHRGEDRPGQVVLWRAVGAGPDDEGEGEPGDESWLSRPDRRVAERIAAQVQHWIRHGFPLAKGGARNATASDVMVLVRKRKDLAGLIVARLHARGVPVAGVDRLRLGAPLAVKDLMAALRFAVQPQDDLSLASLLVSPLFGWSQQDLLDYGWREKGVALWDHLRRSREERPRSAVDLLLALLARADFEPPQRLLHWLLVGPWHGRRKLQARLGTEASDPINELLNAALAFAASQTPGLAAFIRWFDLGEGEVKRESDQEGGVVRVMTVHGAKGLQAPIVILADAADDPDKAMPPLLSVSESGDPAMGFAPRAIPLPQLRKHERIGPIAATESATSRAEREEHWRLLYVAMTRAEEALFIAGALPARKTEPPPDSWYARLQGLFGADDWLDDPVWNGALQWGEGPPPHEGAARSATQESLPLLPAWLESPVGEEPRPPRPLAPSSHGDSEVSDPPLLTGAGMDAARRGVLIHRLLERLPDLPEDSRFPAAMRWLKHQGTDLPNADLAEMAQAAVDVLADPGFANVFGRDSLAEVPLAANVGERVIVGTIDRLCLGGGDDPIRIVDFKTSRRPPETINAIPPAYLRQMAAYVLAIEAIYPGRRVEAALLYTHAPRLFILPETVIVGEKQRLQGG